MAAASAVGRSSASSIDRSAPGSTPFPRASVVGRGAGDRVEVETQLELAAGRSRGRAASSPALGTTRDACRRHVAALGDVAQALGPLLGRFAGDRRKPLDERAELVLAEQPDHGVAVVVAEPRGLEIDLDRQVAHDRREVLAHADLVDVLAQLLAQLLGRHLVEPGEQRVQVAELADELGGGLLPHPGHTRDVVGGIALERLVVDHLVGSEAEPLVDPRDVVHDGVLDPGPSRHQPDARRHELEHVEVDGHDGRLEVVAGIELLGDRPDHVVRLEAGHLVDRDAQRLHDLADLGELVAQVVRHLDPGRLVVRVLRVAERRPGQVEGHREVVGLQIGDAAQDDAREAEDAVDELTLGGRQGREREVAAIDEPVAVEQHQAFGGHGSKCSRGVVRRGPDGWAAGGPGRVSRRGGARSSGGRTTRGRR